MGQTQRISKNNTTQTERDGFNVVTLHSTEVVKYNSDKIILNSGGWQTATTKTRMNQVSNERNLGYNVYQKKGEWFVRHKGKDLKFSDGMTINR